MGPSFLGFTPFSRVYVVPFHSISILATLANLALVYYMFLVGLELDIRPQVRAGTRALSISLAGILFAIPVGWALHTYLLFRDFDSEKTKGSRKQVVQCTVPSSGALPSPGPIPLILPKSSRTSSSSTWISDN